MIPPDLVKEYLKRIIYLCTLSNYKFTFKRLSVFLGEKLIFFVFVFETGFLCSPGCPGTHFVDQAGFELRYPPAFAPPECWD